MVKNVFRGKESLILTSLGAVGVIGTGLSAALATPKALQKLEQFEDLEYEKQMQEYIEHGGAFTDGGCHSEPLDFVYKMPVWRKALTIAPYYIPTLIIGAGSITCIISAHKHNVKVQNSLASAYMLMDGLYKEYQNTAKELYGEDSDADIKRRMAIGHYEDILVYDGEQLFHDEYSGRFFKSTMEEVKDAEYHLNRNFTLRGYCELNEFYDFLGLEATDYGHTIGWSIDAGFDYGYTWVDFKHTQEFTEDGVEFWTISYPFNPTPDFDYEH
jgi:hypothetical protein